MPGVRYDLVQKRPEETGNGPVEIERRVSNS